MHSYLETFFFFSLFSDCSTPNIFIASYCSQLDTNIISLCHVLFPLPNCFIVFNHCFTIKKPPGISGWFILHLWHQHSVWMWFESTSLQFLSSSLKIQLEKSQSIAWWLGLLPLMWGSQLEFQAWLQVSPWLVVEASWRGWTSGSKVILIPSLCRREYWYVFSIICTNRSKLAKTN